MLPFGRLLAPSFPDPSPQTSWSCTADGGSSYLFTKGAWSGQEDDGNGYAMLNMPIPTLLGGVFRLSFSTSSDKVSYGILLGSSQLAKPGLTQFDFRLAARNSLKAYIRTDSLTAVIVSGIIIEQLG